MPPTRATRERLDVLLVDRGLAQTRSRARALIMAGRVRSQGVRVDKPGTRLPLDASLSVDPGPRYVSRGGFKLAAALDVFTVDPAGLDTLDIGASTGGFTQALLERGARRVVALDVGKGQLDWTLRNDPRVEVLDRINARYLEADQLPFLPNLIVIDVSFISVTRILPAAMGCLDSGGSLITLVKPQFEVGRGKVGRGGIVRDVALHRIVLAEVASFAAQRSWALRGVTRSAIRGAEGNVEFFLFLDPGGPGLSEEETGAAIEDSLIPREGEETPR